MTGGPLRRSAALDLGAIELVTFDCFGTLLDWRAPLAWLGLDPARDHPAFESRSRALQDPAAPFRSYRDVLAAVAAEIAPDADPARRARFAERFGAAPPFPDAPAALALARPLVRLGVLSNCDAAHQLDATRALGVPWDVAALAEHVGAYKPHARAWDAMVARVEADVAVPRERWLHVSAFADYDLEAARARGIRTAHVAREGAAGAPDFADVAAPDLLALAEALCAAHDGPVSYEVVAEPRDAGVAARWEAWMRGEHLARVRAAPGVLAATLERTGPTTLRARYAFARRADYARYEREHAPALRAEGTAAFGPDEVRYQRVVASALTRR